MVAEPRYQDVSSPENEACCESFFSRAANPSSRDAYTFIALEWTSKLVVAWHLGKRDRIDTEVFVSKIWWATGRGGST